MRALARKTSSVFQRRAYFFEWFTAANLFIIWYVARREGFSVAGTLPETAPITVSMFAFYTATGCGARALVAWHRKNLRAYLASVLTPGWISDAVRIWLGGALLIHTYAWIKLTVPYFHPRLFDQELWDLDQALFLGLSPNVLFLQLFSSRGALRVVDWSYANIFFASMFLTFSFFLSEPSRRVRVAFTTGNTLLWILGAWLYLLLPSLGPVFRFPDLWLPYGDALQTTQHFQALLMQNYQNVLRLAKEPWLRINIPMGIAAFPSLHVAFQAFVFLWMRKLWVSGQIIFAVFLFVILMGSVVTGWHYLIDGFAGIALAALVYVGTARAYRIPRALALRRALGR